MLYLAPNTSEQSIYVTAYEGRTLLDESFTDYLIVLYQNFGAIDYAFIANVESDNIRYTKILIDTNDDDPTNGNILVPADISGMFHYAIYGQNSDTNLDFMDDTVVGQVEIGTLIFTDSDTPYISVNTPTPSIKSYAG
jgi:hypothetical protein